uniref:Uncharacterized protein LOC113794465 n=1 Tax=Dermatophagoides pteronyssinus TaxID=6956 RepID=A0A6P6Y780_DERPT
APSDIVWENIHVPKWARYLRCCVTNCLIASNATSASGSFILRYVVNTTFVNTAMQLMQLPMLVRMASSFA